MPDLREKYVVLLCVTGVVTAIYCILLLRAWWKTNPEARKVQALNILLLLPIMAFAQYFLAAYLYNVSQTVETWTKGIDPLLIIYCGLTAGPGAIAIMLRIFRKKTPDRVQQLHVILVYDTENLKEKIHRDFVRKISHVIQFVAIFGIGLVGYAVVTALFPPPLQETSPALDFWGYGSGVYLTFPWSAQQWAEWGNPNASISNAQLLYFDFFSCLFYVMATSELCRHSASWQYVFDPAMYKCLRSDEGEKIASYALFPAGYLFACLFLPCFAVAGILAGGCLGDLAASQVGLRWGRHKFPHQRKTWEGTIAGCIVTFLAALAFVGLIWSLFLVLCFAIADFLTEQPIPVSDNLFFPLVGILVFSLLPIVGIQLAPMIIALL